ncbi:PSD1 and planctomycete cytochrome C domain-containing protein [Crateriforma conspicua]|uniref:Planctomycete cytochrome C n=1 Tax=Crateriforma conspicua TaxID=2527996 RepID=A0A5C6FYM8_9PLAN|nr:PSD1 and planctomycete cytochrome C domain-containing protein [Crateriforma conspicua]TWU67476.1 Planctomycete cytochrome C [Crateriforma conspicua]
MPAIFRSAESTSVPNRSPWARLAVLASWMIGCSVAWTMAASAQEDTDANITPEQLRFFETKIRPVLVEHCYRCHSSDGNGVRGGLLVDSRRGLADGGDSGPAIVPGDLGESLLYNAITYEDFRMPPGGRLPAQTIDDFRKWIEMGAPDPRVQEIQHVDSGVTDEDIRQGKLHWAYQPVSPTDPPQVSDDDWSTSEIDQFVFAKMRSNDLQPAVDAEANVVLRRLCFDLTGLPPTPEQIRSFQSAWEKNPQRAIRWATDRLLDSDEFGRHWGRHWLDVARYAESSGKEADMTFPHAWRYRDYVIDSFNDDKPYDQFIREQIAGDLLPAESDQQWAEHLIATGFLAIGPKTLTEQNPRQFQADLIDEQIDTTTRAILGVSVACARCHDHKFDPIPQTDYYALAGIFASTETYFGGIASRRARRGSDLLVLPIDDPNPFDPSVDPDELKEIPQRLNQLRIDYAEARRQQRNQTADTSSDAQMRRNLLSQGQIDQQIATLTAKANSVDQSGQPLSFCMGVQDKDDPVDGRLFIRGDVTQPAQEVSRGLVRVLCDDPMQMPSDASGRLELARWMTDDQNPLTARVMVNRIWLHLLGRGLVEDPDNFGMSGTAPTHPELLDHLAAQFVENDWSVKSMVRQIVTSRTYRLSSTADDASFLADPENKYYSRGTYRRLNAESIRDAMLVAADRLNHQTPRASEIAEYGPTVLGPDGRPPRVAIRDEIVKTIQSRFNESSLGRMRDAMRRRRGNSQQGQPSPPPVDPSAPADVRSNDRSVYLPIARGSVPRSLDVFDFADTNMLIGKRDSSNTAQQALFLLNNDLVIRCSDDFARRLIRENDRPADLIRDAYLIAYAREATADEIAQAVRFLRTAASTTEEESFASTGSFGRPGMNRASRFSGRRFPQQRNSRSDVNVEAVRQFCHSLLASAEFRYLD